MELGLFDRLFIFEMANNHCGDVKHGLKIIRDIHNACKEFNFRFAFKFQYRDLDTFIHPDFQGRQDIKYVKRFSDTRLKEEEFLALKDEAKKLGFITVCTPFDEASVLKIKEHDYDVVKIASCSFTDWPLLEEIVKLDKPIIASTAGASLEDIDKVVAFFENRKKQFCLMHCIGAYPTQYSDLQLNQIDLLRARYTDVPIGFSTHEEPSNTDAVKVAIAKGACVFERHVSISSDQYPMNAYSSGPEDVAGWLKGAENAFLMCGAKKGRHPVSEKEQADLRGLKRGVFAKGPVQTGERITMDNVFFAIPNNPDQLVANDFSKYMEYTAKEPLKAGEAVFLNKISAVNKRDKVLKIVRRIKEILRDSHIAIPQKVDVELSHHYGLDRYEEHGAAILNCINREYCKKLIVLLPGQNHPVHHHIKKEETFQVLHGDMHVCLDGKEVDLEKGELLTVERGQKHSFSSKRGVIFEEVSTTHYKQDSFYEEDSVHNNPDRKTLLTFRAQWLEKEII